MEEDPEGNQGPMSGCGAIGERKRGLLVPSSRIPDSLSYTTAIWRCFAINKVVENEIKSTSVLGYNFNHTMSLIDESCDFKFVSLNEALYTDLDENSNIPGEIQHKKGENKRIL
ncbi:hypothetical protein QE152_g4777 [Popillia japonica]|uniref:Uncharacterized protein n=1 Tax=Popillia japonica TaxID=7064 RepID=A0AAW1N0S5_POPJA